MIKLRNDDVPFSLLKKVLYIYDSPYEYYIDEDGYGHAIIDDYKLLFYVNSYGEILTDTIRFDTES